MSKPKTVIQILNPLAGGSAYTNPRRALHFIKTGKAQMVGPYSIRFVNCLEPGKQLLAEIKFAQRSWRVGYDTDVATHMATLDQIRGLPCVAPEKLIRDGRERFNPRAPKCSSVRIVESRGVPLALDGKAA